MCLRPDGATWARYMTSAAYWLALFDDIDEQARDDPNAVLNRYLDDEPRLQF